MMMRETPLGRFGLHPGQVLAAVFTMVSSSALAQRVQLESAVVESVSGNTLAVSKNDGEIGTFFTMQKKVVYETLRGIGISVDDLPADVRANLVRFHTQNFEAFRAFSSGLNALDEGKFAEAKSHFEKATELDPDFALAREMQIAMPQTNAYGVLQLQAVLREAAKNATSAGKISVEVDASRAVAALQSGQSVVVGSRPAAEVDVQASAQVGPNFTSNTPGAADQYGVRSVVGISYTINGGAVPIGIASTNEWGVGQAVASGGKLSSVGDSAGFVAVRGGAADCCSASHTLGDGTVVNWGGWNSAPGASASVTVSGSSISAPQLGPQVSYLFAPATVVMPTSGAATFSPVGGFLGGVSGSVGVNFVTRQVQVNNLGFTLSGLTFSALNGTANYSPTVASGFFTGNYSSGSCSGCSAFSPTASAFTGNFVGAAASGLIFSSIMQTGNGTVSGLHLLSK